jgi:TolB protein
VVNANGSGLRRVTRNSHRDFDPSRSPDGEQGAFRSQRHGNDEIYVVNVDGTGERNLSRDPAPDWGPDWSPDGSMIAFNSGRDSPLEMLGYVIDPRGGNRA